MATTITEGYLQRALPFLASLQRLRSADCFCVCLGFQPSDQLRNSFPHVGFRFMPSHWSADKGIFQHGRFLDALPDVREDRSYLLSDADIIVQRDFTFSELSRLSSLDQKTYWAGWNAGAGDNLLEEGKRIGFKDNGTYGENWQVIPCFNTGVLAMRGDVWKRLRDLYESRCRRFWQHASYRTRTQWLVCWCLNRLDIKPDIMGQEIHCHGHFGMPKGVSNDNETIYYEGRTVLFRHAI